MASRAFYLVVFLAPLLQLFCNAVSIPLPSPPGPYAIGKADVEYTDPTRQDPFAPTPTPRSLMLHIRYPVPPQSTTGFPRDPYFPALAAQYADKLDQLPNGTVESIQTNSFVGPNILAAQNCDRWSRNLPILVFSPGSGAPEALYSVTQEFLASWGYIIIGVDHTYDSRVAEFPNGQVILVILSDANNTIAALVRTQDVLSTAKHVSSTNALVQWIPGWSSEHDHLPKGFGIFGHSTGGETAALSMQNGTFPYPAACSLDGPCPANLLGNDFHGPFLYEGAMLDTVNYQLLSAVWSKIIGWKLAVGFNDTEHDDFTDAAYFVKVIPGINLNNLLGIFAYPDPVMNFHVMDEYQRAFFDFALLGEDDKILKAPDSKYPEIVFENPS